MRLNSFVSPSSAHFKLPMLTPRATVNERCRSGLAAGVRLGIDAFDCCLLDARKGCGGRRKSRRMLAARAAIKAGVEAKRDSVMSDFEIIGVQVDATLQ